MVFTETERNLDRQRGSRLSNCSNGGRRKKIMARGVGGRGGYSHMNPSREEGKTELGGGLGVTRREEGVISFLAKNSVRVCRMGATHGSL